MSIPTRDAALHTLRQRGSVALGVIAMIACMGLLVLAVFSPPVHLAFAGAMLLGAGVGWVLFVRPSVELSLSGVHLRNPLRKTTIPWELVQDVSARWNLEVYAGDKGYPAWAISSHVQRPKAMGAPFGIGASLAKRVDEDTAGVPAPAKGVTAYKAAQLIEDARQEWVEGAASGEIERSDSPRVTRVWDRLDIACLALPAALLVVGLLL